MRKLIVLAAMLGTAAATSASDDEILAIKPEDVPKLWTKSRGDSEGEYYARLNYRAGCATVSYIVEADGTPSTIRVLKAWPTSKFGEATTDMLQAWRYEPTAMNAQRQAIYTVQTFMTGDVKANRELGSNIKQRLDADALVSNCAIKGVKFGN